MVYKHNYLNTLLLLHSSFMLSVVKMLLKGEFGGHALNSHENYIVDHGKSWKNHGIVFLNFCRDPGLFVHGRMVCSAAAFREMALHIWLVGRMKFASIVANLGGSWGILVYPTLLFSLPLSGRSLNMTEILLIGTLSLNSINVCLKYGPRREKTCRWSCRTWKG